MRASWTLAAALLTSLSPPAAAQLSSERVQGLQRECLYRGLATPSAPAGETRVHRVGIGQNCPGQYPMTAQLEMPMTARLVREEAAGSARACTYEQAGATWTRSIPITQSCPLAAGMLTDAAGGRSRTDPR